MGSGSHLQSHGTAIILSSTFANAGSMEAKGSMEAGAPLCSQPKNVRLI